MSYFNSNIEYQYIIFIKVLVLALNRFSYNNILQRFHIVIIILYRIQNIFRTRPMITSVTHSTPQLYCLAERCPRRLLFYFRDDARPLYMKYPNIIFFFPALYGSAVIFVFSGNRTYPLPITSCVQVRNNNNNNNNISCVLR